MGSPVYLFGQPGGAQSQQPSFVDTILSRFMAGLQIAQTIKQANQEAEERKLRLEQLKNQISNEKFQTEYDKRLMPLKIADLLSGKPGQMLPGGSASTSGLADIPAFLGGPGGYQAGPSIATPGVEAPHPETTVSLADLLPGTPDIHYRPMNQQQTLAQTLLELRSKGAVEAQAAGAKAGAEAGAKAPYEQALEKTKSETQFGLEKFKQGQENARTKLTTDTSRSVAQMNLAATQEQRKFEQANKLSDDFRTETKDFATIDDAYAKIQAGASLKTGAGDVALLYGYMKLLDPVSAVREGEVATAQNTSGVPDRILAAYNKAIAGESLAPAARANFVAAAKKTYESVQPRLKMIEGRYQDKAKKAGLDPKQFKFQGQGTEGGAGPKVGDKRVFPNGRVGVWDGTGWAAQ